MNGRDLALGNAKAAHELGIRFVHQDLGLVGNLDGIDNLALGFGYTTGAGGRIRWSAQREKAREIISHVVDDFPVDALASSLSVFQRTALAIARASRTGEIMAPYWCSMSPPQRCPGVRSSISSRCSAAFATAVRQCC